MSQHSASNKGHGGCTGCKKKLTFNWNRCANIFFNFITLKGHIKNIISILNGGSGSGGGGGP